MPFYGSTTHTLSRPTDTSTIQWALNIFNISEKKPFRTSSISTQFNLSNISANDMHYWTMHSGIYNNEYTPFIDILQLRNGTKVADTLYTQIGDYYVDKTIRNNAPNNQPRQNSFGKSPILRRSLS